MRIFIVTLGTRGDFELFALLARTLAARGHEVTLGTSNFYADAVRAAGLRFAPVGHGSREQMIEVLRSMGATRDRLERTRAFASRWLHPQLEQGRTVLTQVGAVGDYFVSNLKLALARGGNVVPGAFVTYDPPASPDELAHYGSREHAGRILELVALPRRLADPNGVWGGEFHFTGFWQAPAAEREPGPKLQRFVSEGSAPVVLTLGSMLAADADALIERFARALRLSGQRGVVVSGWSVPTRTARQLCVVPEADYNWLFERASCVIHHGGVGTLAAVLSAGKPSILLPQIYGQALFGRWLEREGLSAGVLEAAALTPEELAAAIRRAVEDGPLRRTAQQWSALVRSEPGVQEAADLIEKHRQAVERRSEGVGS